MRHFIMISILALSAQAFAATETDTQDVKTCLENWKAHPFSEGKPKFRVISPKVKVMGIGGRMAEEKETSSPVRPGQPGRWPGSSFRAGLRKGSPCRRWCRWCVG